MPKRNGPGIELLADPTRRRIVAALALRPRRPSSLAAEIGLSRPATTRQLHLLRDAGLVRSGRSTADGRAILFALEPRRHGVITAWLAGTEIGRPGFASERGVPIRPAFELIDADPRVIPPQAPDDHSA
ncbi:MAG: metalloregulator ArsR/SmtB family transcription factor [Chloroflexota bacterium]